MGLSNALITLILVAAFFHLRPDSGRSSWSLSVCITRLARERVIALERRSGERAPPPCPIGAIACPKVSYLIVLPFNSSGSDLNCFVKL